MDREEVEDLWGKVCGRNIPQPVGWMATLLVDFANTVEARAIERCAEVCDAYRSEWGPYSTAGEADVLERCAAAIRALNNEGDKG